ncbi:MAG TPA: TRAP transporter substrate-binding protein, partial [Ramlibacter sp.]|nr:TRAP transporter substrate-binding protein [Ramlibacter sp.]
SRFQRQTSRDAATGTVDQLKKAGMQVNELPAEEVAKLRNKLKPVITKHGRDLGETLNEFLAEIAKARK